MKTMPLISVIVPVYNVESYLRKCLDSICGQTYRNLEILCVDDGSTDASASILKEYAAQDKRIQIFTQPNSGLSAARNTGLQYATGEWIAGIDSDDFLDTDAFEYALADATDETDIITFGVKLEWMEVNKDSGMEEYFNLKYDGVQQNSVELLSNMPVTFCDKLWRRSFVQKYDGCFPVGLWYEDTHFFFTLAPFARQICFRPEKKYHYVRRVGSIVSQSKEVTARTFDRLRIASKTLEFFETHQLPTAMEKIRLVAFMTNFLTTLELISPKSTRQCWEMAYAVALQYHLLEEFPAQLRFLKPVPWWLKPFITRRMGKVAYKFFGIPIVIFKYRGDTRIIRFIGIKLMKNKCINPPFFPK